MATAQRYNLVDSSWELTDPNPDIFAMFVEFSREFFWDQLGVVEVKWSKRMTLCAGLCRYSGRAGQCTVVLSEPLLKLRPRKDLVETLLHEMIHAYLFVADGDRERDAHGPKFQAHMRRINQITGTNITIYHSFNDEVDHYKVHWWKCDGPCQHRPPYYGTVKRSMNRKPGPYDFWFKDHQSSCGGTFIKIREPESQKNGKEKEGVNAGKAQSAHPISHYFPKTGGHALGSSSSDSSSSNKKPKLTPASTYTPSSSATARPPKTGMTSKPPKTEPGLPRNPTNIARPVPTRFPVNTKKPTPNSHGQPSKGHGNFKKPAGKPTGGGMRTAGTGSRTVTVITLDDDNDNTNVPARANVGNPATSNVPVRTNVNNSATSNMLGRTNVINPVTNNVPGATAINGGMFKKPEDKSTGFVPFSGKGYTLGSRSKEFN